VSLQEQIMSKDKYPSIFLCQMEAIVCIILQIFFFAARVVQKFVDFYSDIPQFKLFSHVTCLNQSGQAKIFENLRYPN